MKLTDKAIRGMVSKSPGRNESEPIGGLVRIKLRRPSPPLYPYITRSLYFFPTDIPRVGFEDEHIPSTLSGGPEADPSFG